MTVRQLLPLALGALIAACVDGGTRTYDEARAEYVKLVQAGALPTDSRFDAMLEKLNRIDPSSRSAPAAQKLVHAILAGRERVKTPLAQVAPANTTLSPAVVEQLKACARLAEMAGRDGGVDPHMLQALDDCRAKAERLDAHDNATP